MQELASFHGSVEGRIFCPGIIYIGPQAPKRNFLNRARLARALEKLLGCETLCLVGKDWFVFLWGEVFIKALPRSRAIVTSAATLESAQF